MYFFFNSFMSSDLTHSICFLSEKENIIIFRYFCPGNVKLDALFQSCVGEARNAMAHVMSHNIQVSKFELQSRNYIHFWTNILWKGMDTLITSAID